MFNTKRIEELEKKADDLFTLFLGVQKEVLSNINSKEIAEINEKLDLLAKKLECRFEKEDYVFEKTSTLDAIRNEFGKKEVRQRLVLKTLEKDNRYWYFADEGNHGIKIDLSDKKTTNRKAGKPKKK